MARTYRVGLIGCGRMGATIDDEVEDSKPYSHAAAIVACERTELVAVCDPLEEKAQTAKERYGAGQVYSDYQEMIRQEDLDIVSIATRPSPHAPTVVFAAENGVKGIYCEKPLCNSMRQADAMLGACERNGVKFNYGTQRRYTPIFRRVREMIEAGDIGELQSVVAYCGLGAAQWGHTHTTDMMLFLAGDGEVDFVQGHALIGADDWDGDRLKIDAPIPLGYAQFKNAVRAYMVGGSGYEFEASGSEGFLRISDNGTTYSWRRKSGKNAYEEMQGPEIFDLSGTQMAFADLAGALDEDGDTQGNIHLACRSQEIIFGLIESERQNGARVYLPLSNRDLAIAPDHY